MRYFIECRFKSLTQPQEWEGVVGNERTFTHDEVQMFKQDLGPDDWDHGMEYRTRVHPDYVVPGMQAVTPIHPPRGLCDDDNHDDGAGHTGFVKQMLGWAFTHEKTA